MYKNENVKFSLVSFCKSGIDNVQNFFCGVCQHSYGGTIVFQLVVKFV